MKWITVGLRPAAQRVLGLRNPHGVAAEWLPGVTGFSQIADLLLGEQNGGGS